MGKGGGTPGGKGIGKLVIRADAGVQQGTGHVMRCLALAQAWMEGGGDATFLIPGSLPAIEERLRVEEVGITAVTSFSDQREEASWVADYARREQAGWVVVDGYGFGAEYQRTLKRAGLKVLFVDDYGHAQPYCADLVLNQNAHACEELLGQREAHTRLLLGPRYALLRREFLPWISWKREISANARKVLITLGGSDPDNVTLKVFKALSLVAMAGLEVTLVVGGTNPHLAALEKIVSASGGSARLLRNVADLSEWMAWADVAVAGAGATSWEMCFMGLPGLLLILAENQRRVGNDLAEKGVALSLDATGATPEKIASALGELLGSSDQRSAMSQRGRGLVDGQGAGRVRMAMTGRELNLRSADLADGRLLWEWANDRVVREISFHPEVISWEAHTKWFAAQLGDPGRIMYVAENSSGLSVGQVRYQMEGSCAVLSVSIGAEFRGKGYGTDLITMTTRELFRKTAVRTIHAYVKPGNKASLRLFERAGFANQGTTQIEGHPAVHFVLQAGGTW